MIWQPAQRVIRLVTTALIVLVGAVAFAPERAVASCGHYVFAGSGSHYHEMDTGLETFDIPAELAAMPKREVPCSGQACGKGPVSSPLPAAPLTLRTEPWCSTAVVSPSTVPVLSDLVAEAPQPSPQSLADSIERPPRLHAPFCDR
jgi:hypothetical protein